MNQKVAMESADDALLCGYVQNIQRAMRIA